MANAVVLGAGMVGSVLAVDLSRDFDTTAVDASDEALARLADRPGAQTIRTVRADLSDPREVRRVVADADIVAGALPSAIGYAALRAVIEAGRNLCDISFMPEDPLELDTLAQRGSVTAVVDCGVAPGMSHLLAGDATLRLNPCERIDIYVGGLPVERRWPFAYKAAFSPADVLEEYTRPARLVEHGRVVVREALSEPEPIDVPGLGTLEAFNTDGLRSLVRTLDVPFMREKTLRYPGHAELMRVLRSMGLFDTGPVRVGPQTVRPRDVTAALLFPMWTYAPGEEDLTVMRVVAEGTRDGRRARIVWDLLDRSDPSTGASSMARTTAFPCAIIARLIAAGRLRRPGVVVPERLAQEEGLLDHVLAEHAARGVRYHRRESASD